MNDQALSLAQVEQLADVLIPKFKEAMRDELLRCQQVTCGRLETIDRTLSVHTQQIGGLQAAQSKVLVVWALIIALGSSLTTSAISWAKRRIGL